MEMFWRDYLECGRRGDTRWIAPENIRASGDSAAIADTLSALGLSTATIGVIGLEPYAPWHPEGILPYRQWNIILNRFPDAEFKPVAQALSRLMLPLSAEEIAVVRRAASIGDAMVAAVVATAAAGVSESEVYAISAEKRTGTVAVSRRHPGPWGSWFSGRAQNSYSSSGVI